MSIAILFAWIMVFIAWVILKANDFGIDLQRWIDSEVECDKYEQEMKNERGDYV